ncbi:MAG: ferritin family protein [bacterium]
MDVIEFAMQMELDGKAFYEKGAKESDSPELKKILTTLAEEEEKHYRIFRALRDGETDQARQALGRKSNTPALAKNVFQQLRESGVDTLYADQARALWEEAIKVERKSEAMYREAAEKEVDAARKELLNVIADEEKDHIYLIDNMISFMSDPQAFVQSAQYRNFMSWEGR